MSTINPMIPLSFNPMQAGPDLNKMISLAALAQRLKINEQQIQGQNALKQIFADPSNLDPTSGMPTNNAISRIMAIDPATGMQIRQDAIKQENTQLQQQGMKTDLQMKKLGLIQQEGEPAYAAYQDALKRGLSEEQARGEGQKAYSAARNNLAKSGLFSEKEIDAFAPPAFDPVRVQAGLLSLKDRLTLDRQDAATKRAERAEQEHERHDRALEGHALKMEELAVRKTDDSEKKDQAKQDKAAAGLLSPEQKTLMAQQYLAGDKSVFANLGRGAQGAENIAGVRGEIAKQAAEAGMSGADIAAKIAEFSGITAGERTLGTRTAQVGMAVSEAQNLIPLALEASEKVDRTRFPSLNSILLAGEKGVGDEDVVKLGVATNSLINVYSRAISPTGTPTVSDKEHARELLSAAWGKGQYRAAIEQLQKEMQAAAKSPGAVRQEFKDAVHGNTPPVSDAIPKDKGEAQSSGGAAKYAGAPDVVAAFKSGKLTRDEAAKILRDNGWAQ